MTSPTVATIKGNGLITGLPITASVTPRPEGSGIRFVSEGITFPASATYVVDANRGVTLGLDGKTLSIVEHFLAACAITQRLDLCLTLEGGPELPLLDGSAQDWASFLIANLPARSQSQTLCLTAPVRYQDPKNPDIFITAFPSDTLGITYLMNFNHPSLRSRWWRWTSATSGSLLETVAPARTFGFVSDLPKLQAQGMALGVTEENTLGLLDDGGLTSDLRLEDEPLRHKVLDLIGDLMLCGIPIEQLRAEILVSCGGHASHLTFGQQLFKMLIPV